MTGLMKMVEQGTIAEIKRVEARSLTQILESDARAQEPNSAIRPQGTQVYSPKLGRYIPINSEAKGEIQKYNIGLGPGSWY